MASLNRNEEVGWFEVSDEEGRVAALRPIATVVYNAKVYSLMGAIRMNEEGESEGGLVLVRQSSLLNSEGTRYEVVSDNNEIEHVMGQVMAALLTESPEISELLGSENAEAACGSEHGPFEFCYCDNDRYLQ
ncbi:MAG: hypothetical protein IJ573_08490 [Clostridia bacterium]|nr:hypothetical protein [Clostridia bacterium]